MIELRFDGLTADALGPLHGRVACFLLETLLKPKFGDDHRFERTWNATNQQRGYRTWVRSPSAASMIAMQVEGMLAKLPVPADAIRVRW